MKKSTPLLSPATASGCTTSNNPLPRRSRIILHHTPAPWPSHPVFFPGPGSWYARCTQHLIATEHHHTNNANTVIDKNTGQALEYYHLMRGPDKDIWKTSLANDLGRLAQGVVTRIPTGTNTVFFIPRSAVPAGRTVTYLQLVASIRPHKTETHRACVTVGGNRLDFPGDTTTNCASLTTTKCILNSTISTPGARFITLDIMFFITTPPWGVTST